MATQIDAPSSTENRPSNDQNAKLTSSWAGIVCKTNNNGKKEMLSSNVSNSNNTIQGANAKTEKCPKSVQVQSLEIGNQITTVGNENGQSNKNDSNIEQLLIINPDSNPVVSLNKANDNDIGLIVSGKVSVPTEEVDPAELSEFIEIKRTRKDKNKKKDNRPVQPASFGKGRLSNSIKDRVIGLGHKYEDGTNRLHTRYDRPKPDVKPKVPIKNSSTVLFVNNAPIEGHNKVSPPLVNGPSTPEIYLQDEISKSTASSRLKTDKHNSENVLENHIAFVPAPVPSVNIWEKRKSVPIFPKQDSVLSKDNMLNTISLNATEVKNTNLIKKETSSSIVAEPPVQTTGLEPNSTNPSSNSTPTPPSQSSCKAPQPSDRPSLPSSQGGLSSSRGPAKSISFPTSHTRGEPVVITNKTNKVNKEASDFRETSDWPSLVEVHQAQEALQISQVQKATWRKDKSRKASAIDDEAVKDTSTSSGERIVAQEAEKPGDEEADSPDDDSLKGNRDSSSNRSHNTNSNDNDSQLVDHKKNSKVKKQSWKRLDLPPPRREKGFRRDSSGRGYNSMDWRADAGRGRGAGHPGATGTVSRGGKGASSIRGRGRGRGGARRGASQSPVPSEGAVGVPASPSTFEGAPALRQEYSEVPEYMMPYYVSGVHPGYMYSDFLRADEAVLKERLKKQVEYYFSANNLAKDIFMRRKMDPEGYMPLSLIASFNRMKQLTSDVSMIVKACKGSAELEVKDDIWVRTVHTPTQWPLKDEANPEYPASSSLPQPVAMPPTITLPPSIAMSRPSLPPSSISLSIMNPEVPEFVPETLMQRSENQSTMVSFEPTVNHENNEMATEVLVVTEGTEANMLPDNVISVITVPDSSVPELGETTMKTGTSLVLEESPMKPDTGSEAAEMALKNTEYSSVPLSISEVIAPISSLSHGNEGSSSLVASDTDCVTNGDLGMEKLSPIPSPQNLSLPSPPLVAAAPRTNGELSLSAVGSRGNETWGAEGKGPSGYEHPPDSHHFILGGRRPSGPHSHLFEAYLEKDEKQPAKWPRESSISELMGGSSRTRRPSKTLPIPREIESIRPNGLVDMYPETFQSGMGMGAGYEYERLQVGSQFYSSAYANVVSENYGPNGVPDVNGGYPYSNMNSNYTSNTAMAQFYPNMGEVGPFYPNIEPQVNYPDAGNGYFYPNYNCYSNSCSNSNSGCFPPYSGPDPYYPAMGSWLNDNLYSTPYSSQNGAYSLDPRHHTVPDGRLSNSSIHSR